jgi:hypothetical protein
LLQQQDNYLLARGNAVSNVIALYKALGGGWYSALPRVDPATRQLMEKRTDWGNMLDEPNAALPAYPLPDKETSHE